MTRILVIEDSADLAFGLRNNLEIEGYQVTVSTDGNTGLAAARRGTDLIVLDLMLPGMDGFRVLRTLRNEGCATPILILTARGEETDKVRGLRLGADDYVTKPFGVLELLARIEALLRRSLRSDAVPAVITFGTIRVDRSTRSVWRNERPIQLAPKEWDLLIALLQRDGALVSRNELMREVWEYQADVLSRTLDTHIAELRRKLEDDPARPVHILTARKAGYRIRR